MSVPFRTGAGLESRGTSNRESLVANCSFIRFLLALPKMEPLGWATGSPATYCPLPKMELSRLRDGTGGRNMVWNAIDSPSGPVEGQ